MLSKSFNENFADSKFVAFESLIKVMLLIFLTNSCLCGKGLKELNLVIIVFLENLKNLNIL